jgi:tRNA-dihydrouridine synthase
LKDVRAPGLRVTYNGEVRTLDEARELLTAGLFDGVMMGRALIDDPFKLAFADSNEDLETRENVARLYAEWLETGKNAATNAESANMNPMLNLFHGHPKSKLWKRILLEDREQPSSQRIRRALEKIV